MASERERLDSERTRLAEEERELATMGKAMKRRRRLPFFVAAGVVVLAILIAAPLYYFKIYLPGQELSDKLARISALEERIAGLTAQLEAALNAGDVAKAEEIAKEIEKARIEKEKLAEEVPEERMACCGRREAAPRTRRDPAALLPPAWAAPWAAYAPLTAASSAGPPAWKATSS